MQTDLDLAPAYRTQANLWKVKFFEMREAVVQANKGIRRLRRKLDALQLDHMNVDKLESRLLRNKLQGDGDER